ncbi:MAG: UDP-N-acetylmuramoyl-tripeptide--D-alanyl-D-alanine ligase, partial [Bacteroidetes bacterium]|nr:UDP-N-acetylmuramoyl-tripeptide--D-alanyl-D-alanine ligase [Bacteroidota bacterium]
MIEQLYSTYLSSTGICTDTRSLAEGNLFIALKGPSFNANDFVLTALSNGALACVVDENREEF